jgi:hypothetical protein
MKLIYLVLALALLSGCGPSKAELQAKAALEAKMEADKAFRQALDAQRKQDEQIRLQSVHDFVGSLASLKAACETGCTHAEFRDRELKLVACWEANKSQLAKTNFGILQQTMADCESCWSFSEEWPGLFVEKNSEIWDAATRINPQLLTAYIPTFEEQMSSPDYTLKPMAIVQVAIYKIADQCDKLMAAQATTH